MAVELADAEQRISRLRSAQTKLGRLNKCLEKRVRRAEATAAAAEGRLSQGETAIAAAGEQTKTVVASLQTELQESRAELAGRPDSTGWVARADDMQAEARARRSDEMLTAAQAIVDMLRSECADGPATFAGAELCNRPHRHRPSSTRFASRCSHAC